jgi:hypothetical protein
VAADLHDVGTASPGERVVDAPAVAHLAHERVALAPDEEVAAPATVPHAVGDDLVDGQHEVVGARGAESGTACTAADQPAHTAEISAGEGAFGDRAAGLRQRIGERGGRGLDAAEARAAAAGTALDNCRVAAVRLGDQLGAERARVVRAEERDGPAPGKGQVEQ